MKRLILLFLLIVTLALPVHASDFEAPSAPEEVGDLIPAERSDFGSDLWNIILKSIGLLQPQLLKAAGTCLTVTALVLLASLVKVLPGDVTKATELATMLAVGTVLFQQTGSMITLAAQTVQELSDYGKLLLPVLTAAMAAQGGFTTSAAIYGITAVFDALLCTAVTELLIPVVYIYIALCVVACVSGEIIVQKVKNAVKWAATWGLKIAMYVFTGYLGITGVVSGTVDAAAAKATKLTISGMVPVVGGILADASETVIVGAGVMKNAAGIYGLLVLAAIFVSPFLSIGLQYLMLKLTAALCEIFDVKPVSDLVKGFSSAMGLLVGMTGAVCVVLMISTVCFMKGIT